jgi:hypothetical protein
MLPGATAQADTSDLGAVASLMLSALGVGASVFVMALMWAPAAAALSKT